MSARDGLGALSVGGTFAAAADLVVNGGDVLVLLATFLLDQSGLIYLLVARLSAAAPNVSWLPAGTLEAASTAIALFTAVYALYRLTNRFTDRFDDD
ncbi:hypothetical protein [Halobellus captivus]|uniref:hypothetical protein n=1 Tax=Halobellus captivus TaxID=2592614 RepID=UPI0011A36702|nr:hypothetical protein [Halobellus captivus]